MNKLTIACSLLLSGIAFAGTVNVATYHNVDNAALYAYTYTMQGSSDMPPAPPVENKIFGGLLAKQDNPNYNWIYATALTSPLHVVGTGYTWKIKKVTNVVNGEYTLGDQIASGGPSTAE